MNKSVLPVNRTQIYQKARNPGQNLEVFPNQNQPDTAKESEPDTIHPSSPPNQEFGERKRSGFGDMKLQMDYTDRAPNSSQEPMALAMIYQPGKPNKEALRTAAMTNSVAYSS